MYDWLNEFPFGWLLVAALAFFYIGATAIYTRVMILVTDRSSRAFAKREGQRTRAEPLNSHSTGQTPRGPILSDHGGAVAAVGWDRITSNEIELTKRLLAIYRSELLAYHAEELRALDAEEAEIEAVERAISAFAEKYPTKREEGAAA